MSACPANADKRRISRGRKEKQDFEPLFMTLNLFLDPTRINQCLVFNKHHTNMREPRKNRICCIAPTQQTRMNIVHAKQSQQQDRRVT
jgi:hypothetical protein